MNERLIYSEPPDPKTIDLDTKRLELLINDLLLASTSATDSDTHGKSNIQVNDEMIIESYNDLLLSNNFLYLLQLCNKTEINYSKRLLYSKLITKSIQLNNKLINLIQIESIKYLDTILEICDISYKYQDNEHDFLYQMDLIKPKFDTNLLNYIDYSINEELIKLKKLGCNPIQNPSKWLLILKVIQQGILAEFEIRYERLLDPLLLILRFNEPIIRTNLLKSIINNTSIIDLQYLRTLGINMKESIELTYSQNNQIVDENTYKSLLQLYNDIELYLSQEYIDNKMNEFELQAKQQNIEIIIKHRNPIVQESMLEYENYSQNLKNQNIKSLVSDSILERNVLISNEIRNKKETNE